MKDVKSSVEIYKLVTVLVRVLKRHNHSIRGRKRDRIRNRYMLLWKLTNPKICKVGW